MCEVNGAFMGHFKLLRELLRNKSVSSFVIYSLGQAGLSKAKDLSWRTTETLRGTFAVCVQESVVCAVRITHIMLCN